MVKHSTNSFFGNRIRGNLTLVKYFEDSYQVYEITVHEIFGIIKVTNFGIKQSTTTWNIDKRQTLEFGFSRENTNFFG